VERACIVKLKKEQDTTTRKLKYAQTLFKRTTKNQESVQRALLKIQRQEEQQRKKHTTAQKATQRASSNLIKLSTAFGTNQRAIAKASALSPVGDGESCENDDVLTGDEFGSGEEVVRMIIQNTNGNTNGTTTEWCLSKHFIKYYCSEQNLSNPPFCKWEGANDDSGHGGQCGNLKLLQISSRGGETWLITVELGRKLLEAAESSCSHDVRVIKLMQVAVGSTAADAGGSSTSHGNNRRWVWGFGGSSSPSSNSSSNSSSSDSSSYRVLLLKGELNVDDGNEFNEFKYNNTTFTGHTDWVFSVSFSPDGQYIVSGSKDFSVRVWSAESGELVRTLEGHTAVVHSVSFSPDGQYIVSGSKDKSIRVWSVESGELVRTLEGHTHDVNSVSFSPDGQSIVSGSDDETIRVWSVESGELVWTFGDNWEGGGGVSEAVMSVSFSPDGQYIVSGTNDGMIHVWSVESGELVWTLEGHTGGVYSVSFSPDGLYIVSGSEDFSVRVWSVQSGELVRTLEGHTGEVNSVLFSRDGQSIVSGSDDKTIRVWSVETGELVRTEQQSHRVDDVSLSSSAQITAAAQPFDI